jgi:hypothetical protein
VSIDDLPWLDPDLRAALRDLRVRDPDENLRARFDLFRAADRPWAERRFGMVPQILEHGWATCGVGEGLVYSLGLHYRYQLPEIMIVDRALPDDVLAAGVNRIVTRMLAGAPPDPGRAIEDEPLLGPLTFGAYAQDEFDAHPCGYLYSFYRFFGDEVVDDVDPPVLIACRS